MTLDVVFEEINSNLDVVFEEIHSNLNVTFDGTFKVSDGGYEQGYVNGYEDGKASIILREKSVDITKNGIVEIMPDDGEAFSKVNVNVNVGDAEIYTGSYEVTPQFHEQILETAHKVMRNDVKIKNIPITTVSNTSGGRTLIIGE